MNAARYDEWPIWRLWVAFAASWLWPGSTRWQEIAPVLERKTALKRTQR
ncbi:MAG: hypothetical protein P9F75_07405 [Candidatus Contendobacter sp.]|nr:hypothetical protein [Candidatus Contendobacter sp.]